MVLYVILGLLLFLSAACLLGLMVIDERLEKILVHLPEITGEKE